MTPDVVPPAEPERRCLNCGQALLGEHCYACGQPTKGLVRHFSSIIGDFMDSVFELDSRILRTLGPLLFKPGYLSEEYFAGRRVRYVSPVRLMVFLSLFAFFAAQLSFKLPTNGDEPMVTVNGDGNGDGNANGNGNDRQVAGIRSATTVAEVESLRDQALEPLRQARKEVAEDTADIPGVGFGVGIGLDVAEKTIENEARRRIAEIEKAEAAGEPVPVPPPLPEEGTMSFNGRPWHPVDNPLVVDWMGESGNAWLNGQVGRAKENIERIQKDPNLLKDAFLSTVPTTLFVLLPLFALLLKIVYVFKRRLYMEHLIVALHSHSFLCLSLLLALVLDALAGWTDGLPWLSWPLGWLEVALIVWMPVYLLLMQKRVYRQGWIMTLFKFSVLGTCYLVLVSFGASISLLVSLVNM